MRVHHLDCGETSPRWSRTAGGTDEPSGFANHCLLVETANSLVLVDTGLGMRDVLVPTARLSGVYRALMRPRLRTDSTAVRQVRRLGFDPRDVQHIILSHLDCDRAGGLDDFPEATVHLRSAEVDAALARRSWIDRMRYRPQQWASLPRWRTYATDGEHFMGCQSVRQLEGLPPEILLVPLTGHTSGHAGVAIRTRTSWLLYAGDAYVHHGEMDQAPSCPRGARWLQWLMEKHPQARIKSRDRLRALARVTSDVTVFCAHDRLELDSFRVPLAMPPADASPRRRRRASVKCPGESRDEQRFEADRRA